MSSLADCQIDLGTGSFVDATGPLQTTPGTTLSFRLKSPQIGYRWAISILSSTYSGYANDNPQPVSGIWYDTLTIQVPAISTEIRFRSSVPAFNPQYISDFSVDVVATQGGGSGEPPAVVVTSSTQSSQVIQSMNPGDVVRRASIRVTSPFNGASPTLMFGTPLTNDLILSVPLGANCSFSTDEPVLFAAPDQLILTYTSGGSTSGQAFLTYDI